ncbi:F-box/kelch-repeat protein At3g06240-like isoform X1 [Fagus crenata]
MKPAPPLCHERIPREATNTYSYARPLREKYPSLPSWEVQVTNDSGEGETMIVPRKYPNVPWTGGSVDTDFVEECYSLIGSMKNWIWSSSQSSFARQNKLSHENDKLSHENNLLRNRVESQASTIRTLERCIWSFGPCEAGGSSDPIPDATGGVTPSPAGECNPMNTILQSKKDSSRLMKCLAPKHPSRRQVREGTTLATIRSKSGDLPSGEQITRDDDEEGKEDTTPLVQRQSKRGRL